MKRYSKKYIIPLFVLVIFLIEIVVMLSIRKPITIIIDGKAQHVVTYRTTVSKTLQTKKIYMKARDRITPSLSSKITKNQTIIIKRAVGISIALEGKTIFLQSSAEDVSSLLKEEGITLGTNDRVKPTGETKLSEGMNLKIVRVDIKELTEPVGINFETVIKYDRSVPNTQRRTTQNGVNGTKNVTYSVVYEDKNEVSRTALSEKITKPAIDKIILQGTYPLMPINRDGEEVSYSKVIKARATAYYAVNGIGRTYTASGRLAVRNPDGYSTIAVDPSVIPLGTRLFVEGYGFAIAAEVGSGVKDNKIDVFFDTYREACNWAVKYVNMYILK